MRDELQELSPDATYIYLLGDINIHHRRYLRHSDRNTQEGEILFDIMADFSIVETLKGPTRGSYLLDLVLTNAPHLVSNSIVQKFADHSCVVSKIEITAPKTHDVVRKVRDWKRVNWERLNAEYSLINWKSLIEKTPADQAIQNVLDKIVEVMEEHAPEREIKEKKRSHPWMNDRCKTAVEEKLQHQHTEDEEEASKACSCILTEEYKKYLIKIKNELKTLPRNSKKWWKLNRILLDNAPLSESIPALKNVDGKWVHGNKEKANLFREAWCAKFKLPPKPSDPASVPDYTNKKMSFVS